MVKILHGENLVESRKALSALVEKARNESIEVVVLNGQKTTLAEMRNCLTSDSLLGRNRLVVVENLLSQQKSVERKRIIEFVEQVKFDNDLVLWEEKELKSLPKIAGVQVEIFKVNQVIFRFLESLRPGNTEEILTLLGSVKEQEEPEMIFYMLIRQIRLLILAKDQSLSGLADWQKRRLAAQARYFTLEQLKNLQEKLLLIDFTQKTSGDPYPLSSRLDLLVVDL